MAEPPFKTKVVRSTTPTSTGTKDFTSSGFGTPSAILVQCIPTTTDSSDTSGLAFSWGVSNGDKDRACGYFAEDAVGTTNTGNVGSRDHCVYLLAHDGATLLVEAAFDSWITDGVRLDFTVVDSTAYTIVVTLLGGSEFQADVGDYNNVGIGVSEEVEVNPPGSDATFEPDAVLTAFMGSIDETTQPYLNAFFGIAVNNGSEDNACAGMISEHNVGTSDSRRRFENTRLCERWGTPTWPSFSNDIYISAYSGTGFTFTKSNVTASPRISYIAMKFSDDGRVPFEMENLGISPTSTGTESQTWPGHRTGLLYSVNSTATDATNLQPPGAVGMGLTDIDTEFSVTLRDERNAGTSNSGVLSSDSVMDVYSHDASTHIYEAEIDSQDLNGFTLDWTTVTSARGYAQLSVLTDFVAGEDGAGGLPALTGAGVASEILSGSDGAGELPNLEGAGIAALRFVGTDGAGELSSLTGTGAAFLAIVGVDGAGELPSLEGAGASALTISGVDGAGELPSLEGDGASALRISGDDGAGELPPLEGEGAAAIGQISGTDGGGELPSLEGAAVAALRISGADGAGDLPTLIGSGAGALAISGADGAGELPSLDGAGVAALVIRGVDGAGLLPALDGAGIGALVIVGIDGSGLLPSLEGVGIAVHTEGAVIPFPCEVELRASRTEGFDLEASITVTFANSASRTVTFPLSASRVSLVALEASRTETHPLLASIC